MWQNYALYHTDKGKKEKKKKNYLQYIQMTVFNLYNLCKKPCNVVCCDYSQYEYLIKTPPAFSERVINIQTIN